MESSWNVMAHGDAQEGKWRGNWRMDWVVSTLHTTSEHGVTSITTTDSHASAASNRLNWCPRWFKWTRPSRQKTKSGFCACAITFQTQSTTFFWDVSKFYSSTRHHIREKTHLCSHYYEIVISHNLKANNPLSYHIKYSEILLKCIPKWNCK